ncbi:FG-GAP-like repeat-containing protein [Sediminibacter sp. Hel_I_10]|uniref:FG-GAP-like repeat-containing protein n=1 Tax=Sediminibacter sp. Hel_I_10 TaxID=1392490 RepID=UPI0004796112|nr:FG-GAP-like repeat-containing protein [Sediminibacter sp. Hel_I_10]
MKNYFSCFFVLLLFGVSNAQISFVNEAPVLGLDISSGTTFLGNGITFHDYDGDGWDDITLTSGSNQDVHYFKNNNGAFVEDDFTVPTFLYQTRQVNWVDIDNDGDKDLFVTSDTNGNRLLVNNGDMVMQDITNSSGISPTNFETYGASWGDYDNDGFLDVFLSNRSITYPNKLYRNNGDQTFTEVSVSAGIDQTLMYSFCSAFLDINNDGFQDLYVSNDKYEFPNKLYKNNGDGTFTDISESSGAGVIIDAMTVTVGDFNNDGWFDIYLTNTQNGNVFLKNNGDETFTDIASSSNTLMNSISWGAAFFDADNDTNLDLYVCSQYNTATGPYLPAAFYVNDGDESFTLNNSCFSGDLGFSHSNAIGDVDNDGFPDMAVSNNMNQNMYLWHNNTTTANNWLKIKLQGAESNRDAVGARLEMTINGEHQFRYTHCGEGYLSQNSSSIYFGLGATEIIDELTITWPNGLIESYTDIEGNETVEFIEGATLNLDPVDAEDILIYPNPVKEILYVRANIAVSQCVVYDVSGRIVSVPFDSLLKQADVSNLTSGMYLIKISSDDFTKSYSFIKK